MISVIVPTLNAERSLPHSLEALVHAAADGLVREVVVVDGGSSDHTRRIADAMGCNVIDAPRGRGPQLAAGAKAARHPWLLFLHADTVLETGWEREIRGFLDSVERSGDLHRAAAFRFALDSFSRRARLLETAVALRCALFRLPYGDQGLVIHRRFYDAIGGYAPLPLMEDVDMVRRIGRRRLVVLRSAAVTSPDRYERTGYLKRSLRNLSCLTMYLAGVSPERIARRYEA